MVLDGKADKTVANYLSAIAHLSEHFGTAPDRLSEEQVRSYLLKRRREVKLNSMRPVLGAIKFFYRVTVPRDWATLAAMRLPRHRTVPKVLSPSRCWRIIGRANKLYLRAALQTAYTCGLRLTEVRHLRTIDIDSSRRTLMIRHSKGQHERNVPLAQGTIDVLRKCWREHRNDRWLFPSRAAVGQIGSASDPISERSLQRGMAQLVESLGWTGRGISFHTLRHSYATAMLDEGVNLKVLQRYLGHKNLQATEVYLHLSRRADERGRQIIDQIMNGPPTPEASAGEGPQRH